MKFIEQFYQIDIEKPWLFPYVSIHNTLKNDIKQSYFNDNSHIYQWLNDYFNHNAIILKNFKQNTLSFTHQNDLPHGTAYELFISQNAKIPTRDNLHDWFNACIWSVFQKSKAILNHHHLLHLDKNESGNKRNRVRDAITVFDENGIVLAICNDTIGNDIKNFLFQFDWQHSLISPRANWHNPNGDNSKTKIQAFVFGHALLEQLTNPRKNLCGHCIAVMVDKAFFTLKDNEKPLYLDSHLTQTLNDWLNQPTATPKDLQPLPILGIPHFWHNQDDDFYNDGSVFRTGRKIKE